MLSDCKDEQVGEMQQMKKSYLECLAWVEQRKKNKSIII